MHHKIKKLENRIESLVGESNTVVLFDSDLKFNNNEQKLREFEEDDGSFVLYLEKEFGGVERITKKSKIILLIDDIDTLED